jgi:DNA-binding CsgD family transcriptional regulator
MVAATLGDVSPVAVGVLYCAVVDVCYFMHDLGRAREWTTAFSRWCNTQNGLVQFRGKCLVLRAEMIRLSGAWSQAIAEAEQACKWLTQCIHELEATTDVQDLSPFTYPIGPAFYQLAEIHRLRGNLAKAETAYRQASRYGYSPEPGLALLRLAQGRHEVAAAAIQRMMREEHAHVKRARVLMAFVEIMIAIADLPAARAAANELAAMADCPSLYLQTLSAQTLGSVLLAEGDAPAALAPLRRAWMGWQEMEAPWEAAHVRVLLGRVCGALGDQDAAELEFEAALRVFERLEAAPDIARVATLRRKPALHGPGALTRRERQIIQLVATGKTNRAIADQLAISERTVDRHVSNILSKLSLPSRTAATAYVYERGLL